MEQTDKHHKLDKLKTILQEMKSVLIAYSGGVDSTFLMRVAKDVLGEKVLAVTAASETYPEKEVKNAAISARKAGVKHLVIRTEELMDEKFSSNPPDRCYHCKRELFVKLSRISAERGIANIITGTNLDDMSDYRPGTKAAEEAGIRSPLKEAGLSKAEIRSLSKEMGLDSWDKPAYPCLSTRFPYGAKITGSELSKVARAEEFLTDMGLGEFRVRVHGDIARIEVPPGDMAVFLDEDKAGKVVGEFKKIGYNYVTLDLEGYRTGSMNEVLPQHRIAALDPQ
ncbi:MAG: ATP-dependent sacrificial sulfur transferase LarE [Candidatus Omnitrophica bacterium]|nr:ATP-dependent sacrificial sulfur transferase LarE [Candidatus Omnitrophota bacterium]